jgi:hypothetical protein
MGRNQRDDRNPAHCFGKEKQNTAPSRRAIHPISKGANKVESLKSGLCIYTIP